MIDRRHHDRGITIVGKTGVYVTQRQVDQRLVFKSQNVILKARPGTKESTIEIAAVIGGLALVTDAGRNAKKAEAPSLHGVSF